MVDSVRMLPVMAWMWEHSDHRHPMMGTSSTDHWDNHYPMWQEKTVFTIHQKTSKHSKTIHVLCINRTLAWHQTMSQNPSLSLYGMSGPDSRDWVVIVVVTEPHWDTFPPEVLMGGQGRPGPASHWSRGQDTRLLLVSILDLATLTWHGTR